MNSIKQLYAAYRTVMIIGASMGGALIFYVIVVEVFKSYQRPVDTAADRSAFDLLRLIFYGVSILLFAFVGVIREMLQRAEIQNSVDTLIKKLVRANTVTLAICEIPAFFGLILYLAGGFYTDFYILLGGSMLLLFFYFPRYNRWKEWIRQKAGADWDTDVL